MKLSTTLNICLIIIVIVWLVYKKSNFSSACFNVNPYILQCLCSNFKPYRIVCIYTCMYINCALQCKTQEYNLLPYIRSWVVHCCTVQHSPEDKYKTTFMEVKNVFDFERKSTFKWRYEHILTQGNMYRY